MRGRKREPGTHPIIREQLLKQLLVPSSVCYITPSSKEAQVILSVEVKVYRGFVGVIGCLRMGRLQQWWVHTMALLDSGDFE